MPLKKPKGRLLILCLVTTCFIAACGQEETSNQSLSNQEKTVEFAESNYHLRDKELLYQEDSQSVKTLYLTIKSGDAAENTNHTWEEINTYSVYDYEKWGLPRYQVAALLQAGDDTGPLAGELGYSETVPNATVQVRGQTSSRNQQKNYKIKLKRNKGSWQGQRTINLNKHQTDGLRFRNKLAYDLIRGIPQLIGLRTQFVHLYVKDENGSEPDKFVDYGLYTQVEQLNGSGLKAHGLDSNAQLYKVNFFEFLLYEDTIKLEDDPDFDRVAFEKLLEIKGDRDHHKLIEMLQAVNDLDRPIDQTLDTYFDRENLTYWLAFQILIGNTDTQSRNVYLYSPQNSQRWYFIPWDHDSAFFKKEYEIEKFAGKTSWESGISNYWGNRLFQRALKSATFRQELDEAIQDLKGKLNPDYLSQEVAKYQETVKPYVTKEPDSTHLGLTPSQYDEVAAAIPKEIESNYQDYLDSLKKPMPFFIGIPEKDENGKLKVRWDAAYDLNGQKITYKVEVAKDFEFKEIIHTEEGITLSETVLDMPEKGHYFARVTATNEAGETRHAFDYYVTEVGKHFGVKSFFIQSNGKISEDVYEE
ncbi:CotH kinase family protein [uncultured Abiotrophia sp.]|uniref:CotH kinase family protein n=1 Tax=uncultured Abiotrophia sp. TaxID=316094 RepID=UPI0028D01F2C|nr:CotH kinase family protein [uncultured Abiotrophia sp.]